MDSKYFLGALLTVAPYFVSATFQALVEKGPLVVPVGEDAILPCWLSRIDQLKEVRWFRIRANDVALINLFRDGKDQQTCYIPRYVGRTELITTDINSGKVALKIRNVSVADEGAYRCYLETLYYFDHAPDFELKVTALGSDPKIDLEELQDGRIKAVCRSEGWYPEPMLLTKDTDGKMVELESSNKIQNKEGLYYIEYSRLIAEKSSRSFSCILRTAFPNQERESSLYVADAVFWKLDSLAHWWTVGIPITLSIIGILVAALVSSWFWLWCWCSKRRRDDANEQSQEDLDLFIKDKEVGESEREAFHRALDWVIQEYEVGESEREALQRKLEVGESEREVFHRALEAGESEREALRRDPDWVIAEKEVGESEREALQRKLEVGESEREVFHRALDWVIQEYEAGESEREALRRDPDWVIAEKGRVIMKYEALKREIDLFIKDKDASSGANTEDCPLNVPPEEVSRDSALTGSDDMSLQGTVCV